MTSFEKINNLAIERAGNIPSWQPFRYTNTDSGMVITGCATSTFKRGPRKGEIKYLTKTDRRQIVLSASDLQECNTDA